MQLEYLWFLCWLKDPECEKVFRQMGHWKGRSPVCSRVCSVRWCLCLKALSQWAHGYGRVSRGN